MSEDQDHDPEPMFGIFQDMAEATLKPPTWIINTFIPVGLTFIAGPPKSNKSTVAMAIAALVTDHACQALPAVIAQVSLKGSALIFSAEATAGELRYMLEHDMKTKLRADESLLVADDPFAFRLDDSDGLTRLLFWLNQRKPRLVVVDPLRDLHDCEEKDSGAMIRILRPLRQWAVDNNAAIICVHHTRKPGEGGGTYDAIDMRGSGAIFGKADGCVMITPRDKGQLHLKCIYKRGASWEKTIRLAAYDSEGRAEEILDQIDELVLRAVVAGASSLESIATQLRISKGAVVGRVARLAANKLVKKGPDGRQWVPTSAGKERVST